MWKQLRISASMLLIWTLFTGVMYPAFLTGFAQLVFPRQANGSLIVDRNGTILGSRLIGQRFSDLRYFWGRPSATAPYPNNAAASGGSNLGPTNPALIAAVSARIAALRSADPTNQQTIPVDLVTASGSGLDPHISPAAATYQAPRIAHQRKLKLEVVNNLIARYTEGRQWGFLGEPRVNVLELNLALDGLTGRLDRISSFTPP